MKLNQQLYDYFEEKAQSVRITHLTLGLGYTAVQTDDGGMGLSYTFYENKKICSAFGDYMDFEGRPAITLLEKIKSDKPLERSMALALINALNYQFAVTLPEDRANIQLIETFDVGTNTKVAMVGYIKPLENKLAKRNVHLEVIDHQNGIGESESFYSFLKKSADLLLLTSTTILNNTTEDIFSKANKNIKAVMLGPGTPMIAEAFEHLPIQMLAGTVPVQQDEVLKVIRHGLGTRFIHQYSKKVVLNIDG